MKHTPGSWMVSSTGNHQALIHTEKTGENIAVAYDKKNAQIVAAAPDMLKTLKQCQDVLFQYVHGNETPEMCVMTKVEINAARIICEATE